MSVGVADGIVPSDVEHERAMQLRRGRRRVAELVVSVVALVLLLVAISPWIRITVSLTDSLPQRVFIVWVGRLPARGELVAFHPPPNRFYPDRGGFIKHAIGLEGDVVRCDGRRFFLNDSTVGEAKTHSLDGRPLDTGPVGVIPQGHYFVWTPERDSFDSRYADIGWIGSERIVGVAVPLF